MASSAKSGGASVPGGRSRKRRGAGRVAVVDIGSNSIRLVVFDGLKRTPVPLFNEKVLCGLGRGLAVSGRLNEQGVELALANLLRFTRLADAMGVEDIEMLATAAVREASNGQDFVAEVERRCGRQVRILSGEEEAELSGLGVIAGIPDADGVSGDLGGGSLELVALGAGGLGPSSTLPLGPLRLLEDTDRVRAELADQIDQILDQTDWLASRKWRRFYAVGGAWRTLARIDMEQRGHPLHIIHGYTRPRAAIEELARLVSRLGKRSLARMAGVSRRRVDILPTAALVLGRVLARLSPEEVVFCAYGLREGALYARLPAKQRRRDPLLDMASSIAAHEGRFGDLGKELALWIHPLFTDDTAAERRLRLAACHLSDIAWQEHPDYRAEQALLWLLRQPSLTVDHAERAFLALAIFLRYGGSLGNPIVGRLIGLLSERGVQRAQVIGLALRLGYTLSGGTKRLLARSALSLDAGSLGLRLPEDGSVPSGEVVERRLNALRKALAATGYDLSQAAD
jgi:exopolyphosphatase/guanosine-5'-triphosphate,3'-diphosphate pyrophosphatase